MRAEYLKKNTGGGMQLRLTCGIEVREREGEGYAGRGRSFGCGLPYLRKLPDLRPLSPPADLNPREMQPTRFEAE
jgi:hypothetical protein